MIGRFIRKVTGLKRDESGAALIVVTMSLPLIFGMAAFAVDLGYAYYVQSRLQTAADLGALAGGTLLAAGDKNAVQAKAEEIAALNLPPAWIEAGPIDATPVALSECSTKLEGAGLTCYGPTGAKINYVKVTVTANTPMFFARLFGFKTASLSAEGIVAGEGASMPPLNVAIVLDTTASMTMENTTACGGTSMTKLACAKQAALGMLQTLWPVVDQVALYTYPGMSQGTGASPNAATTGQNASKNVCASGVPMVTDYKKDANPASYKIVDFSDDYRDKNSPPTTVKNKNSNLVKALDTSTGCKGLQVGTTDGNAVKSDFSNVVYTFYADSIDKAQADLAAANDTLTAAGKAARQNVIVILSDGDANATTTFIESARRPNQCLQGITAAQNATAAGTWVYSVAYSAGTVLGGTCKLDTTQLTSQTVTVKTDTTVVTYTQTYNTKQKKCNAATSSTKTTTTTQVVASPGPAASTTGPTRSPSPTPVCSSTNKNISYTDTTVKVTVTANPPTTSTKYDRTACDAMRKMASTPDKFFSIDPVGTTNGCISAANPNTTDLVTIFKKVAVSMMKKRRIPKAAL